MILLDEAQTPWARLRELDYTEMPVPQRIAEYIQICGDHLGVEVQPVIERLYMLEPPENEWAVTELASGYSIGPTTIHCPTIAGVRETPGFSIGHEVFKYDPEWGEECDWVEDAQVHSAWQAATALLRLAAAHTADLKLQSLGN